MLEIELSSRDINIEPGGTAQVSVTLKNNLPSDDRVYLEVEGLDVEWYAIPVPAVNIKSGECAEERIIFRMPRSYECRSGDHPFVVRAKAMESAESAVTQGTLNVSSFSMLQLEIEPHRATTTFFNRSNELTIHLTNLGNREETLELSADDPDEVCTFEFQESRVHIQPGDEVEIPLVVEPVSTAMLGATRLYGFTVTARSIHDSFVSATTHGQLEKRALISPTLGIFLALLFLGAIGWTIFHPRPVVINRFTASPMQVQAGQPVVLSWDVSNMKAGSIQPEPGPIKSSIGVVSVLPQQTTTYTLYVRGATGDKSATQTVTVIPLPPPAKPAIQSFSASPSVLHPGDSTTLSWNVAGQGNLQVSLNPPGLMINPLITSQIETPTQTTVYKLTVQGPGGIVSREITVTVVGLGQSVASISSFKATPSQIAPGQKTTLSWITQNASLVSIDNNIGESLPFTGKEVVTPTQTTTYTLIATDNKGLATQKSVTVNVTPPAPVPPTIPTPGNPPVGNTTTPINSPSKVNPPNGGSY